MARGGAVALSPVCAYVAERTGSSLSEQQILRLREVLSAKMKGDEDRYVEWLKTVEGAGTLAELMAAIAVHKTDLFRDEVQLDAFVRYVLRPLVHDVKRPLHFWSAGCATGEEVATLLILLREAGAHPQTTVLGTDISEAALKQARTFTYHPELIRRVPQHLRERYFRQEKGGYRLISELSMQAQFQRHNLMDAPYPLSPLGGPFDVIFCRNVLIYFTDSAFDQTVAGLSDRLTPDGTLVLSAAEPLLRPREGLVTVRYDQAFFYQKTTEPPRPPRAPWTPAPVTSLPRETPLARPAPLPPSPPPAPSAPVRTLSREIPAAPPAVDPREEAAQLFALVLDWAAAGEPDPDTEQGLRRCLYLDPHLAQARYLLGMLLEQRGAKADAAAEYRRALAALNEGRCRATSFFLNDERLKTACARALDRLGYRR